MSPVGAIGTQPTYPIQQSKPPAPPPPPAAANADSDGDNDGSRSVGGVDIRA